MATYELAPAQTQGDSPASTGREGLGNTLLLANLRWFTRVRWIAAAIFAAVAAVFTLLPNAGRRLGIEPPASPLWALAAALAVVNVFFVLGVRPLKDDAPAAVVARHLWAQIAVDLLAVTYLVHTVGSVTTFVSYTYLFHIAMACIFFPRRASLAVLALSALLYLSTVGLEAAGVWPPRGAVRAAAVWQNHGLALLFAASAVTAWLVVWYFVSTLSTAVRRRDLELRSTNEALSRADREKNQVMLVTTHDLKAPFTGIERSISALREREWEGLSDEARDLFEKIEERARTLRERINAILLYGELRAEGSGDGAAATSLAEVAAEVVAELSERAGERGITIVVDVPPVRLACTRRDLSALLSNIIANAVIYSREGGRVEVDARELLASGARGHSVAADRTEVRGPTSARCVEVAVRDEGIGIRADALPHVFDEYFRTNEASRHNARSTGLGLAIVKEIARRLSISIRIESVEEQGTTVTVVIPATDR